MITNRTILKNFGYYAKNHLGINEVNHNIINLKRNNLFKIMEKNHHSNAIHSKNKNIFLYDIKIFKICENISLNQKEIDIFSLINNVLIKNNKKTICRVAGGWVRDKVIKLL